MLKGHTSLHVLAVLLKFILFLCYHFGQTTGGGSLPNFEIGSFWQGNSTFKLWVRVCQQVLMIVFSGQTSFVKMKSLATAYILTFRPTVPKFGTSGQISPHFLAISRAKSQKFRVLRHKLPKVPSLDHNYQDELPYESQNCY